MISAYFTWLLIGNLFLFGMILNRWLIDSYTWLPLFLTLYIIAGVSIMISIPLNWRNKMQDKTRITASRREDSD